MNLSRLTNKNLIELNSELNDKDSILQALAEKLYENDMLTSKEEFMQAVYAREALSETGMEGGLAIPHGKSDSVKRACFAVMTTKNVVSDWESLDPNNQVKTIFLLAIPEDQAGSTHLELLAELMTRMSDATYKETLFQSRTAEEFCRNLDNRKEEKKEEIRYTKSVVAVTACPAGIAHTYMSAEALVKAGDAMGVKVYVEKQGANGIEDRHTAQHLREADAAVFAADVAVKESERFSHLAITKVPVAEPIKDGTGVLAKALKKADGHKKGEYQITEEAEEGENLGKIIKQSVMTGISYMIPIIVAGGMIGAFAVLVNQVFGLQELYDLENSWLWLFRKLGSNMLGTILIPVLSAYMAYSIADKTALAPGFAAGLAANMINGGFLCGMLGGLIAGFTVKLLRNYIPAKGTLAGFVSFWIYPVLSTLIVGILLFFVVGKPVAWLNTSLIDLLGSLGGTNAVLLGAIIGIMVSFDLGGPINKAAYAFCVGAMSEGVLVPYAVFASVKMVSGFAITMATKLGAKDYSKEEKDAGNSTWILVLAGITEGAIPFMMEDPIRVIFSLCTGSAVTGAIVSAANIGLDVPGAGIFSIFMLSGQTPLIAALIWVGAAVLGAAISGALLIITRKMKLKKMK